MGLSTSKTFEEMFPEPAPNTPSGKRVIDEHFDPRSPSGQITRTPIQVTKLPDQVSQMPDPRSPTEGIDRTPIYSGNQSAKKSGISMVTNPEGVDEREASQESTGERPVSHYGSMADLLPTAAPVSTPTNRESKKKRKAKKLFKIHTSPTSKDSSPSKTKAPEKSREVKNSPLSTRNIDYNSPRAIVQRKQSDKLAHIKGSKLPVRCSSPRYQVMEEDKENINY